jgi:hypothetical protein
MRVKGYMVDLSYEDGVLTAHARNKMARLAMASEPELSPLNSPGNDLSKVDVFDDPHIPRMSDVRVTAEEPQQAEPAHERPPRETLKPWLSEALSDDLVLPKDQIAAVELKDATLLTNGRMTITTTTGNRHRMHFLRKQRKDFQALATALRG